jgi:hypothetical protein
MRLVMPAMLRVVRGYTIGAPTPTPFHTARRQPVDVGGRDGPGLAVFLAVTAFDLLGDGLRDAFDPRAR